MGYRLVGCKGCGSAIVEAAFARSGVPVALEEVDYEPGSPTRDRLLALNPLGQVPVLVLPDGGVLTESLAMIHHLDDVAPAAGLVPARGEASRIAFQRWSTFIVAALYPTFTYGDDPAKWVDDTQGAEQLRASTNRQREVLWRQVDATAGSPHFLGDRPSALDLYVTVMTRWRPGRKWFAENAPRLVSIAETTAAIPEVAAVLKRNFG